MKTKTKKYRYRKTSDRHVPGDSVQSKEVSDRPVSSVLLSFFLSLSFTFSIDSPLLLVLVPRLPLTRRKNKKKNYEKEEERPSLERDR